MSLDDRAQSKFYGAYGGAEPPAAAHDRRDRLLLQPRLRVCRWSRSAPCAPHTEAKALLWSLLCSSELSAAYRSWETCDARAVVSQVIRTEF